MKIPPQVLLVSFLLLFPAYSHGQTEHLSRNAAPPSDSARLEELNRFIGTSPQTGKAGEAYGARFSLLLSMHQDSAAFFSLHQYLASRDSQSLSVALQDKAMELGVRRRFPDTALVLIDSSISLYKKRYGRPNPSMLYTRAWILYLLDRYAEAESTQTGAMAILPPATKFEARYGNYYEQLGVIQLAQGEKLAGLRSVVHARFVSTQPVLEYGELDSLVRGAFKDSTAGVRVRDSLFGAVGMEYLAREHDLARGKSYVAAQYARNHVLLSKAEELARQAYDQVKQSPIENRSNAAYALGVVLYNREQYAEAEKYLAEATSTIPPNETELYSLLGSSQEKQGKKDQAFATYLDAAAVGKQASIMRPLALLQKDLAPHSSLDSLITAAQRRIIDFFPDKYDRSSSSTEGSARRVVLAELFTGTESRPCQAVDIAYDKLLERFDRSELVIAEYNLHGPRPDPLVNGDDLSRETFYHVGSTPTSIIEGTEVNPSGGPGTSAKYKFAVYAEQIEKALLEPPQASIRMSARMRRGRISFAISATIFKARKSARLRIVLLEDPIRYTGLNGISEHRFVVRKMIRGAGGVAFTASGKATVRDAFKISSVEDQLDKYLSEYEANEGHPGGVFKERKSEIDPSRLYLLAFVQDNATRSILQSGLIKVKR